MADQDKDIEQQYKETAANLKKVNDDLKAYAEQSDKEIKLHQKMSEETKASVDKLLSEHSELQASIKDIEQQMVSGDSDRGNGKPETLGDKFVSAEGFDENIARLAANGGSYGMNIKAAITSVDGSAGATIEADRVPGIITPGERRLTIRDLLTWGRTTSNSIEYVRESGFTNNADVVSEGPASDKPESDITFELLDAKVATIAHLIRASKQVLDDSAMLASHINGRLQYGLKLKEEAQLLKGSGLGLNINGLYTQASAYSNPGVNVTNDTNIDRLRIALLQVILAEYEADAIVLNPIEWTNIELTKDANGNYIFGNPQNPGMPSLWSKPVVATQALAVDEFLVGAFAMGAQGWDREDINVQISTEDKDNFSKNMVTIRCEERVALTDYRPESFVKGNLTIGSGGA